MRTTLDLDEDVLNAAKELAARENKTAGEVISELARKGIHSPKPRAMKRKIRNGFEVLAAEKRVVTPKLVQKILEETGEA